MHRRKSSTSRIETRRLARPHLKMPLSRPEFPTQLGSVAAHSEAPTVRALQSPEVDFAMPSREFTRRPAGAYARYDGNGRPGGQREEPRHSLMDRFSRTGTLCMTRLSLP
jgi:hypothetical protein